MCLLNNSVLSMFPLKSIEAIKDIEENLQNDEYNIKIVRIVKCHFNFL
jgi:hypothetical protein